MKRVVSFMRGVRVLGRRCIPMRSALAFMLIATVIVVARTAHSPRNYLLLSTRTYGVASGEVITDDALIALVTSAAVDATGASDWAVVYDRDVDGTDIKTTAVRRNTFDPSLGSVAIESGSMHRRLSAEVRVVDDTVVCKLFRTK